MLIYLDSNIVVYLVEDVPHFGPRTAALVAQLADRGDQLAVSHLVRMECKVGALSRGDVALLQDYVTFFSGIALRVLELPSEVFDRAAELRASSSLGAMDALHLAAAIVGGCEVFLTNDQRLAAFPDISVMLLSAR
jgi:predicted nucleic acid-binding protein